MTDSPIVSRSPIWVRQDRPKPPVDQRDYSIYERDPRRPRVWWSSYYHAWVVTLGLDVYFYDSWLEAMEAACRAV